MTPILPGGTLNGTTIVFKSVVTDPDGGTVQLKVEVQPVGTNFTGQATTSSGSVASGSTATATQAPLTDGQDYHWQSWTFDGVRSSAPVPGSTFHVTQVPAQLVFIQQPTQATAGVAIAPAIKVQAQDANGNPINTFTGTVTLQISNNAGNGTLSGAPPTAAVAGTATFSTASIDKAAVGYTLVATTTINSTLISRISSAFTIIPGAVSQLAYQVQPPPSTPATSVMTPPIKVAAQDAFQNVVTSFTGNMFIAIGTNPSGGTLSGTTTVAAVSGVATFATLSINNPGANYTLRTTIPSLPAVPGVVSQNFTIANAPGVHLVFTTNPPASTGAGVVMTPAIQVTARDDLGFTIPGYTTPVTVAIGSNPGGGTLGGTLTVTPVSGVATFNDLTINKVGTSYTLVATATGATTGASSAFNITFGLLSQLVFTVGPTNTTAGVAITPAVQVAGEDQFGNVVTSFTGNVGIGFATNPSGGSFTPTSTTTVAAVSGVAVFSNLHIRTAGPGYSLQASTAGIPPSPASNTFTIIPAPAVSLGFTNQPGNPTTAGVAINSGSGGVVVTARDSVGNVATGFTSNVTMIASGGNPLTGTTTVPAINGNAIFNNLRIRTPVGAYTLQASSGPLTSPPSSSFNIVVGPATRDTFMVQPTNTAVQAIIDSSVNGVTVWITDSIGNLTSSTSNVTVALFDNTAGGTLNGTKTQAAAGGIARFNDLRITKISTLNGLSPYTLIASASGLAADVSVPFDIIPGPAKSLVFKTQPSTVVAGQVISPPVQVAALDAVGDTATGFTGNVTLALNPSSTLGGTNPVAATAGIATFSNLTVGVAQNYTLTASTPALPSGPVTSGTSTSFTVQPGGVSAGNSTVGASPGSITASSGSSTSTITVTAKDAGTNIIAGATVVLTISGTGNTTSPVSLTATTNGSGQAIWTLSSTVAESKTVSAVINSVSITQTATVVVNPATATVLVFTKQPPASVTAGVGISPAVQVEVRDAFGNRVTSGAGTVTLSILQASRGTLSNNTASSSAGGVATFNGLSVDKATTTGVTQILTPDSLIATAGVLTPDTSSGFAVNPAGVSATQSTVTTLQTTDSACSSSCTTGAGRASLITITAKDQFGNVIQNATVVMSGAPATGNSFTAAPNTNSSGVSTSTFNSTKAEAKTISSTVGGVLVAGPAVTVIPAGVNATHSSLSAGQSPIVACQTSCSTGGGTPSASLITVTARDQFDNTIQNAKVVLSDTGSSSTFTAPPNTNSSGVSTSTFTSTMAELHLVSGTLQVGSGAIVGITQTAGVTVNPDVANSLAFTTQPSDTHNGNKMNPAVVVTVFDQFGNIADFNGTVTLTVAGGGSGITGNSVSAASGVATFGNLILDTPGTYNLNADGGGLPTVQSNPFNIT